MTLHPTLPPMNSSCDTSFAKSGRDAIIRRRENSLISSPVSLSRFSRVYSDNFDISRWPLSRRICSIPLHFPYHPAIFLRLAEVVLRDTSFLGNLLKFPEQLLLQTLAVPSKATIWGIQDLLYQFVLRLILILPFCAILNRHYSIKFRGTSLLD
mmetsp:Transcript_21/g.39  ORF Transcript_21/g.39 Transcript_21/m.39 type:complete len:154 (-) Transcript_21:47-508(-)